MSQDLGLYDSKRWINYKPVYEWQKEVYAAHQCALLNYDGLEASLSEGQEFLSIIKTED